MTVCGPPINRYLATDDLAAINHEIDGYGPVVANPGWEMGTLDGWSTVGTTLNSGAGAKNGSYYTTVDPGRWMQQEVNYYHSSFPRTMYGSVWIKDYGDPSSHLQMLFLFKRDVEYPATSGCDDLFPGGIGMDAARIQGAPNGPWVILTSNYWYLSDPGNWRFHTTATIPVSSGTGQSVDLRLRLYNWTQPGVLDLDSMQIYDAGCTPGSC